MFSCYKCAKFCNDINMDKYSIFIYNNINNQIGAIAIRETYDAFSQRYGNAIEYNNFEINTYNLIEDCDDAGDFKWAYSHNICVWFKQCTNID